MFRSALTRWFTPRRRPHAPRPHASLRLEALEDRTVPAMLTVMNNANDGAGSLRAILGGAHDGDTITFAQSLNNRTITLTTAELAVNASVNIQGLGASHLTVSGNDTYRVFDIASGKTVTIADLTIAHGHSSGMLGTDFTYGYGGGGGILNQAGAHVTLNRDTLSDNTAEGAVGFTVAGGALLNRGSATILSCQFTGNQVAGGGNTLDAIGGAAGGAIDNMGTPSGGAQLAVANSTFTNNSVISAGGTYFAVGGAIESDAGLASFDFQTNFTPEPSLATITNSVFSNNQAGGGFGGNGQGGAVVSEGSTAEMTVVGSSITGNRALGGAGGHGNVLQQNTGDSQGQGGGLYNAGGSTLNVIGCLVANNQAIGGDDGTIDNNDPFASAGFGGGILNNYESTANVIDSVITGNLVQGGAMTTVPGPGAFAVGGGIANTQLCTLLVSGCVVSGNRAVGGHGNAGTNVGLTTAQAGFGFGGGIDNSNNNSTATIIASVITQNQAIGGAGGTGNAGGNGYGAGIGVGWETLLGLSAPSSHLTLIASVVSDNDAVGGKGGTHANGGDGLGGGLYLSADALTTVMASTITHNDADGGNGGSGSGHAGHGYGGGVARKIGSVFSADVFTNISHNDADTSGDDLYLQP
jgi:hypothetical protein